VKHMFHTWNIFQICHGMKRVQLGKVRATCFCSRSQFSLHQWLCSSLSLPRLGNRGWIFHTTIVWMGGWGTFLYGIVTYLGSNWARKWKARDPHLNCTRKHLLCLLRMQGEISAWWCPFTHLENQAHMMLSFGSHILAFHDLSKGWGAGLSLGLGCLCSSHLAFVSKFSFRFYLFPS
jgi:hypothetical protein